MTRHRFASLAEVMLTFGAACGGPQKDGFIATSKIAVDDQENLYVSRGNRVLKLAAM